MEAARTSTYIDVIYLPITNSRILFGSPTVLYYTSKLHSDFRRLVELIILELVFSRISAGNPWWPWKRNGIRIGKSKFVMRYERKFIWINSLATQCYLKKETKVFQDRNCQLAAVGLHHAGKKEKSMDNWSNNHYKIFNACCFPPSDWRIFGIHQRWWKNCVIFLIL